MELNADDVRKLALLSRLHVPEEDLTKVAGQLQHILEHMEELSALDLSDVPPMMHPDSSARPLRPDVPLASLPREVALVNAPKAVEGFFAIPKVIGAA
jgi:aspartyl-tRNA(Asn)/glutamyl-tRNA(Gln) amidotransferase subunit C